METLILPTEKKIEWNSMHLKQAANKYSIINQLIAEGKEIPFELSKNFVSYPLPGFKGKEL